MMSNKVAVLGENESRALAEFVRRTGCERMRALEILKQVQFDLNVSKSRHICPELTLTSPVTFVVLVSMVDGIGRLCCIGQ
jgi:hypothetical protein